MKTIRKAISVLLGAARMAAKIGLTGSALAGIAIGLALLGTFIVSETSHPILAICLYAVAIVVVGIFYAWCGIVVVPPVNYGVREIFGPITASEKYSGGLRLKGTVSEGPTLIIPLITKVKLINLRLQELLIDFAATTKDGLGIEMSGSIQYRPDPTIENPRGQNLFYEMTDTIVKSGMGNSVKSKITVITGEYNGEDFINKKGALIDLINATLRCAVPLHEKHDPKTCGLLNCPYTESFVPPSKVLDFYRDHENVIKNLLSQEKQNTEDKSETELRYGIDIEVFALTKPDFSKKTKEVLEKQKQSDIESRVFGKTMSMVDEAKGRGATFQEAINAIQVATLPNAQRKVLSIEGEGKGQVRIFEREGGK